MWREQAGRSEQRGRGGKWGGGERTAATDKSGNGKSKVIGEVLLAYFKQTKPYVQNVCDAASTHHQAKAPLLTDQRTRLCIGLSAVIGGDGLFSFNYKLAVLVSEADVQIKKVRHARLILANLPLHISPACQLLCDSNHHRHMPLLCEPPPTPPTLFFLCRAVVDFLPGLPASKTKHPLTKTT